MVQYLLGIDNGSTVSKAALFTPDGTEIATAGRPVDQVSPHPGHFERDMDQMWPGTAEAIREVLDMSGIDPADIVCISATGHGNGLYLIDEEGKPVRPGIASSDSRAMDICTRWIEAGVGPKVLPKTTQCIWPGQPNALLVWLRENEPESIERARWVLMAKDYTRFCLTGEVYMELTDMSGTSLMNVVEERYDDSVLEAFGLLDMRDMLPPLRRPEEICGAVTAEAAALTGLKEGTPVACGMFDIDACGLASGIVDETQMSLVAGTWGNNQYISTEPLIDEKLFMTSCYSIPGHYLMLEGSPTSASNLEWFVSEMLQEERKQAKAAGRSVYDLCNEMVASVEPEDCDIVFLPFLYGSNAQTGAKSCFLGLRGHHTRAHVVRAIFEGVVFAHRTHYDRLLQFRPAPETIRFTGGAARSDVWLGIFADTFQLPMVVPAGTELGALGAVIAGAVAVGIYPTYADAVSAMAHTARTQEPNAAKAEIYKVKYARYCKAIEVLGPLWKEWA